MAKRIKTAREIEIQNKAKRALIKAIEKNGEGTRIGTRKTYFEEFGKRLYEPKPETLHEFKCRAAKEGVFSMESTDQQVNAYYLDGDIIVAHHGQDRHKVAEKLKLLKCA